MIQEQEQSNTTDARTELRRIITNKGLVISRVPQKKKQMFIKLAEEECADDYGWLFCNLMDEALEYRELKRILFEGKLKLVKDEKQDM